MWLLLSSSFFFTLVLGEFVHVFVFVLLGYGGGGYGSG
jgi:hypothetical protein